MMSSYKVSRNGKRTSSAPFGSRSQASVNGACLTRAVLTKCFWNIAPFGFIAQRDWKAQMAVKTHMENAERTLLRVIEEQQSGAPNQKHEP